MMQPALFIQGQWRSGQGAQLNKTNPADNTLLWSALSANAEDVDAACTAARTAFPAWARKTVAERAEVIQRFAGLLTEHKTRLAQTALGNADRDSGDDRQSVDFTGSQPATHWRETHRHARR